ncbi:hypothetical protein ACFE04_029804 [Oxalis oulophora]
MELSGKIQMPPNSPWLMLAEEDKRGLQPNQEKVINGFTIYRIKRYTTWTYMKLLVKSVGKKCFSIGFGCLFTVGVDLQINLLHVLSKRQINLPPQSCFVRQAPPHCYKPHEIRDYYFFKAIASTNPWDQDTLEVNQNCVIMTISGSPGMLAFARPRDQVWVDVEMDSRLIFLMRSILQEFRIGLITGLKRATSLSHQENCS